MRRKEGPDGTEIQDAPGCNGFSAPFLRKPMQLCDDDEFLLHRGHARVSKFQSSRLSVRRGLSQCWRDRSKPARQRRTWHFFPVVLGSAAGLAQTSAGRPGDSLLILRSTGCQYEKTFVQYVSVAHGRTSVFS